MRGAFLYIILLRRVISSQRHDPAPEAFSKGVSKGDGELCPLFAFSNPCRLARAGPLRFIFRNLGGGSLVRIVEEDLIAVRITDHQKPVAPRPLLDRNSLGFEFRAQRVQRGNLSLACLRLDVKGKEYQPLANLLRPCVGQDKRAARRSTCATRGLLPFSYRQGLLKPSRST